MAHFVSPVKAVPDPNLDAIDMLYLAPDGSGSVGLWGFVDPSTKKPFTVKVSDGSGSVTPADKRGSSVLVFKLAGVSDGAEIQAFSGTRPFTAPLPVTRRGSANLGAENKRLLLGGDPRNVCHIGGQPVTVLPLSKAFGSWTAFPQMAEIHGLVVHITGTVDSLAGVKNTFEKNNVSAHFAIDRDGRIAQYIAASYQSQGQGPGNPNWLCVEIVGGLVKGVTYQAMHDKQLKTLRRLWQWVYERFPRPSWNLASPFIGYKQLGSGLDKHYQNFGTELVNRGYSKPAGKTILECVGSTGLSCHFWVDQSPKPCPGAAIMSQLPQVLGYDRLRIPGDTAFIAS